MFQSLLIWGTYIWGVLPFEWVLIFEKSVAIASMGTYICGVLVFDGYLYSREYGMYSKIEHNIIETITITCCEY